MSTKSEDMGIDSGVLIVVVQPLSSVQLFVTLWAVAHQAFSIHGISQARTLEWEWAALHGIFPPQGWNLHLLHCKQTLYH